MGRKQTDCNNQMLEAYRLINEKYWRKLECGEITKKEVLDELNKQFQQKFITRID